MKIKFCAHASFRLEGDGAVVVSEFISRYPAEEVTMVGGSELELTKETLPATQHIYVLEQSR